VDRSLSVAPHAAHTSNSRAGRAQEVVHNNSQQLVSSRTKQTVPVQAPRNGDNPDAQSTAEAEVPLNTSSEDRVAIVTKSLAICWIEHAHKKEWRKINQMRAREKSKLKLVAKVANFEELRRYF
jgi:hypothetical protein